MKYDHFRHLPKSKFHRLKDLFHSLRIIQDSIQLIREGKYYQVTVLYGQLRSLLTDKTTKPLLLELGSILNYDLKIFFLPDKLLEEIPQIAEKLELHVKTLPIGLSKTLEHQEEIELERYLDIKIVEYKKHNISVREVIDGMANKYGGSHYADKVPRYLNDLLSFGMGGQPMLDNLIIQIAELCLSIGIRVLKTLTDIDIYYTLYLTKPNSTKPKCIFDYKLPHSPSRITLLQHKSLSKSHFTDYLGRRLTMTSKVPPPFEEIFIINISHEINNFLQSHLKLHFDGVKVADYISKDPFMIVNDVKAYDGFINRQFNEDQNDYEFGMGECLIYGARLEDIERLEVYSYLINRKVHHMQYFENTSEGYSKAGNGSFVLKGVKRIKIPENKNGA